MLPEDLEEKFEESEFQEEQEEMNMGEHENF
jgi:hypothetical protein